MKNTINTAAVFLAVLSFITSSFAATDTKGADKRIRSKVVLVKKIDLKDFGAIAGVRLGDLNCDGQADILLAQNQGQSITCLTAIDIEGNKLWQVGQADSKNYKASFDIPVQIYDIDLDGENEVICAMDGELKVFNGMDGKIEKQVPLPAGDANDCIVIANFSGNAAPQDILLKTRYNKVWALDRNLKTIWSYETNTGHYPWPYDFDGDGRDEIMVGYTMLSHDGKKIWDAGLPGHCDGVSVGDVDGNPSNGTEIAFATCGGNIYALFNKEGESLWQVPCGHSQHIIMGNFRPDLPGKEVYAIDRGNDRSPAGVDSMVLLSADGKQLWKEKRTDPGKTRWISMISTVRNWDGRPGDLALCFRRGGSIEPTLYDGYGQPVASFPVPDIENLHLAQHADIFGDQREEIIVFNEKSMYIYTNGAANPNKLLYNYTQYLGMP